MKFEIVCRIKTLKRISFKKNLSIMRIIHEYHDKYNEKMGLNHNKAIFVQSE